MQLSHQDERTWLMILCQLQQTRIAMLLDRPMAGQRRAAQSREESSTITLCVAVLLSSPPMTAPDLAERIGISRTASGWLSRQLRAHPDIVSKRRTVRRANAFLSKVEFFAYGEFPVEAPRNPDVWAGWRSAITGDTPPRLGLDPMPIAGGVL